MQILQYLLLKTNEMKAVINLKNNSYYFKEKFIYEKILFQGIIKEAAIFKCGNYIKITY